MFIARRPEIPPAPFGGAEMELITITQDRFRSSERRRRSFAAAGYKHCTPTV